MSHSGARNALIEGASWVAAACALAAGIFYFAELRDATRLALDGFEPGGVVVESGSADWDRSVRIAADARGHFALEGDVDGQPLTFMADTGATVVALTFEDADRIGLSPATLKFSGLTRTANGEARVAPVTLDRLTVGEIELRDVEAIVMEPGKLGVNLLGMSFLGRLARFTVEDGELVLTQ